MERGAVSGLKWGEVDLRRLLKQIKSRGEREGQRKKGNRMKNKIKR
jgi:hypothetical protein